VDVQPYAFTTKSLFVGHCDYRYLRWQVIDTPGILDHPLEERNTIEMQAITALAHLTCSVLYFVDISEQCGYTIDQQCSLFQSIRPLFANKQLIIVANKVDQQPWETLEDEKKQKVQALANESNCTFMTMSNASEEGVSEVKAAACDKLLAARVDSRVSSKKVESVLNRLQVVYPTARDGVERKPFVPDSVKQASENGLLGSTDHKPKRSTIGYALTKDDQDNDNAIMENAQAKKTARDLMWENGGPGVWAPDYREQYDLLDEEWKFDAIPQIMDGKNIADYVDPDIDQKLVDLEKEEDQIMKELQAAAMGEEVESDLDSEEEAVVEAIRERKNTTKIISRMNRGQNKPVVPRHVRGRAKDKHQPGDFNENEIKSKMDGYGVDTSKMLERGRKRERSVDRRRRDRDMDDATMSTATPMDEEGLSKGQIKKLKREQSLSRKREHSLARSHSRPRTPSQMGLKDEAAVKLAKKKDKASRKGWEGASGEGDRRQSVHLVQWCNTGKKRMGTTYQR